MRTTLILDDVALVELRKRAASEKRILSDIVNETLKIGLGMDQTLKWDCQTFNMGGNFDYTEAWQKIEELEADTAASKMELYK